MNLHRILKDGEVKAEVIESTSGIVAICWLMEPFQVTVWTSLDHAIRAHSLDETIKFEPWPEKETHAHSKSHETANGKSQAAAVVSRPKKTRATPAKDG